MHLNKNRILAAILALGLPVAAFAQTAPTIVPPPVAPGSNKAPAAPVSVPLSAPAKQAPAVLPPTSASSVNPAATVPVAPPPLIDIALPAAPKPVTAATSDLKPSAPKAKKSAKEKEKDAEPAKPVKQPIDPFAGIIGTPVSDSQLNRFVFPEEVLGVYFPEGAPLPECPEKPSEMDMCKPVFLNGKRVMLLQLRAGAKGPVQMVVHKKSGEFETLNLMPAAGPGAIVRVKGAEDGASDARLAEGKAGVTRSGPNTLTASEQNTEMLARVARGDIPAGFEAVGVDSTPVRYELFDVIQRATWDNGAGLRLHLMQVKAHNATPVVISPALFRTEKIKALALDRDTITAAEPAMLYMLEQVSTENN